MNPMKKVIGWDRDNKPVYEGESERTIIRAEFTPFQLETPVGNTFAGWNIKKEEPQKASKNDKAKPDLSHCPKVALAAMARAFEVGEKKYGRYNYYKGHNASQLVAAMMRHATDWMDGEENDPIDGQPHLGSIMACCAMILKQMELGTLIDNRYKSEQTTKKGDT